MILDLSHLYRTEIIKIERDEIVLFEVVVQEISQEANAKAQQSLLKNVDLEAMTNKKKIKAGDIQKSIMSQAMGSGNFSVVEYKANQNVAGVKSWTLKDSGGNAVPVSAEAWGALPIWITELIEKGIERLNPTLDDEFQD